ncbi:MAG: N-acetylmuramoyl-L-alanine amidase [Akkermansiaceae bacterium]|nr:N-acetylmuramoyl-L-alanine amidase [Armatimonadota bacterium]
MLRPFPFLCLASVLFFSTPASSSAAEPPEAPAMPVAETPDFLGAVWEPAAPTNFKPSARPSADQIIDRIVIHDIEGLALSAVRWFQNPKAQVSSHYVIDAQTGMVYQQVKERDVAWHAGDRITNTRSVGIEHGGYAYRPGFFSITQYEASAKLVRDISQRHNIPRDREHIIGHFEVPDTANPGKFGGRGGHTDPGPYWDWDYFMTLVRNDAKLPPNVSGIALLLPSSLLSYPGSPFVLRPGETVTATFRGANVLRNIPESAFTLTNHGDDMWLADRKDKQETERRKAGTVFLGTASGQDSRLAAADWISPRYVGSSADGDIAPGDSGKFAMSLRAPGDFLGEITEMFRLINVPPAPRQPVPFGDMITLSVRIDPWDITVPIPPALPSGWTPKTMPGGARVYWRKSVPGAKKGERTTPAPQPVVWETNLPLPGDWDVYVRFPGGSGRTAAASYAVNASVLQKTTLDQRTRGSGWRKVGRYRFETGGTVPASAGNTFASTLPGKPPVQATVILEADAVTPGVLAAGDLRFVGPFPAAGGSGTPK